MKKELELYLHIPFCAKKCAYCDFLSSSQDEGTIQRYVDALVKEIGAYKGIMEKYTVTTIFLGGGTPSILSGAQVKQIFRTLSEVFDILPDTEITIEANPGTITKDKLETYRECGINRISLGLQSANDEELKLLGRIHTYEEFLESYALARECGFNNINVDLISAIPKQTLQSWEHTLSQIIALQPEHISAYSLIVEKGTPFAEIYGEGCLRENDLPNEETERKIYYRTEELLAEAGYHRYEISNYAQEGKECRHNLGYWERKEYLGLGLGAASLMENVRYHNTDNLNFYMEHSVEPSLIQMDREELSLTAQMEEFMFLGLRKMQGISKTEFETNFGTSMEECYGEQIEKLCKENLIIRKDNQIKLTLKGIDVSNYVFAEFIGN